MARAVSGAGWLRWGALGTLAPTDSRASDRFRGPWQCPGCKETLLVNRREIAEHTRGCDLAAREQVTVLAAAAERPGGDAEGCADAEKQWRCSECDFVCEAKNVAAQMLHLREHGL